MAGRPPPLAPLGQGPLRGIPLPPSKEEDEEVWEVNLNLFERPPPGNRVELGAHKAAMALFNKPETPKKQLRVAANWHAPHAPNTANPAAGQAWKVPPAVFQTPKNPRLTGPIPKAPKKPTGAERRSRHRRRKSRRQSRRLRK